MCIDCHACNRAVTNAKCKFTRTQQTTRRTGGQATTGGIFIISIPALLHYCCFQKMLQRTHTATELLVRRNWRMLNEITRTSWLCWMNGSVKLHKDEGLRTFILYACGNCNSPSQYWVGLESKARMRTNLEVGFLLWVVSLWWWSQSFPYPFTR